MIVATLLQNKSTSSEPELLYQRALSIYELALGPQHPSVAGVCGNLGRLFHKTGNTGEAESCCGVRLPSMNRSGPEHPDTALSLSHLADLLADQGHMKRLNHCFNKHSLFFSRSSGRAS